MKATAFVLLALTCCQAVSAGPVLKAVAFKAGAKVAAGAAVKAAGVAAAGAGLTAGALSGLPVNGFDKLEVPTNFTVGEASGNLFCFPKYNSANVSLPSKVCPEGFNVNSTSLNQVACVKQVYVKTESCFRSTQCPANMTNAKSEQLCMPTEVRSALIGMLVVFKVKAKLPFMILPALKTALVKSVSLPISLAQTVASSKANFTMPQLPSSLTAPELEITFEAPAALASALSAFSSNGSHPLAAVQQAASLASAGQAVIDAMVKGADPMALVTKSMMNVNVTEIMNVMPQINAWVSEHLQGITQVNNITADISAKFPTCLCRCCKKDFGLDTTVALPTHACPAGLTLNSFLGLCVGEGAGYSACPGNMTRCLLPPAFPVCVAGNSTFGLDSCKMLDLLQHSLPKHQCP